MSQTLPYVGPTLQSQKQAEPVYIVNQSGEYAGDGNVSTSANVTTVAPSTSSTQLLAANAARRGFIITNGTDTAMRIKYGTAASLTSFSVALAAGGVFEAAITYRGALTAVSVTAPTTGSYQVTELL